MKIEYAEMTINDYDDAVALWTSVEGVGLDDDADSRENMEAYLARNPGLSFVARDGSVVVGAVLCGHDGRRGYLHHLAVAESHRRQAIGRSLVDRCLSGLSEIGVGKCNIMVFDENSDGLTFWEATGWLRRPDLMLMQRFSDQ